MGILKIMLLFLLGCASLSFAAMDDYQKNVQTQCSFTRYPELCLDTLKGLGSGNQQIDFMSTLVSKTIYETKLPSSFFTNLISSNLEVQETKHANSIIEYCQDLMSMSIQRLEQSLLALQISSKTKKQDIQTWISAALTFQQTCKDSADIIGPSMEQISKKMDYLSRLGSNPLTLVNRMTGDVQNVTNQKRDFPSWLTRRHRRLLQASKIEANAVVAKDGTGDYQTISEAINAASGGRFVIYVKGGVYNEKIRTSKDDITLIGDGKYSTIIVGDDSAAGGYDTHETATFSIEGDRFIARDIGFQNKAGPNGDQAVALYVNSDKAVFFRCSMDGYQDTVYAVALRQFYRECDIYGTIDFIFGNAAAVFQDCQLVLHRPRKGASFNAILANGRSDPGQNTGFSVQNCQITVSSDFAPVKHDYDSYLGRPWKAYSRSVVMQSTLDDAISSRGWVEWSGGESSRTKTLYFAEFANNGPGAETSGRVTWPGFHVIGADEAAEFTVSNFIAGTSWLPSVGVTFTPGL
ncbi:hypothetical protein SLA2020_292410 [Shorea laevis]